jgi:hypothetical protein
MECPAWPRICAGLETTGGDYLIPVPDSDDEGARAMVQNHAGALVGPLQGRDDLASVHPDNEGVQKVT